MIASAIKPDIASIKVQGAMKRRSIQRNKRMLGNENYESRNGKNSTEGSGEKLKEISQKINKKDKNVEKEEKAPENQRNCLEAPERNCTDKKKKKNRREEIIKLVMQSKFIKWKDGSFQI